MTTEQKAIAQPTKAPPFKIKNREMREQERYLKMLVYGDFGVGKTFLAGTAADVTEMNDVLMISAESGELTIDSTDDHGFENIDTIDVTDFKQSAKVYDFLKLHCQYRDEGNEEKLQALQDQLMGEGAPLRKYRTVIIDSLTELEVYCMNQLLGISDKTGLDDETQSAEWSEYKKQFHMVQRLVRAYRDLPIHVIIVCARSYIQDEQKKMIFAPNLTGKLSGAVQGFMDIVGYLVIGAAAEDGSIPRRMFVQPVGRYAAKNRWSSYKKAHFDNPTMRSILTAVGMLKSNETTKIEKETKK